MMKSKVLLLTNLIKKGHISVTFKAWCGAGSNRRHKDFQSFALPTELPHHPLRANRAGGRKFDRVAKIRIPGKKSK